MSRLVDLKTSNATEISKNLVFTVTGTTVPVTVKAYRTHQNQVAIPLFYARTAGSLAQKPCTRSETFPPFSGGGLYDEQKHVRKECIEKLNATSTCLLSVAVGFGKCLSPDTRVLLYDGTVKTARDVRRHDILMGDDGTPRYVTSSTKGTDRMYSIVNTAYDVDYTVNKEHILTLVNLDTNQIEDVSLSWLLRCQELIGTRYCGFRVGVDSLGALTRDQRMAFINDHFGTRGHVRIDDPVLAGKLVMYARSLGLSVSCTDRDIWLVSGKPDIYPFVIIPKGIGEYVGFELTGNGRFLLADFSVTHNTAIAINIATKIRVPTLIVTHRLVLIDQWTASIKKFCPDATVACLSGKSLVPPDAHFCLVNPLNIPKFAPGVFDRYAFCIVDECHLITSKVLSQSLLHVHPSYLLGLSATPYRLDGLTPLLYAFFGNDPIVRRVERMCRVVKITTKYSPDVKYMRNGKLDWNNVVNSLVQMRDRNMLIASLVQKYPGRTFLLLTKRIEQADILAQMMRDANIEAARIYGKHTEMLLGRRVLIGTVGKCGVGFDQPELDTLVLCCDVLNYFEQVLGRVMRQRTTQAWVFDIVDDHGILHNHYRQRTKTYRQYDAEYIYDTA